MRYNISDSSNLGSALNQICFKNLRRSLEREYQNCYNEFYTPFIESLGVIMGAAAVAMVPMKMASGSFAFFRQVSAVSITSYIYSSFLSFKYLLEATYSFEDCVNGVMASACLILNIQDKQTCAGELREVEENIG